jgi:Raf kinase inhibitor-like YbhB/YbcL family protein
LIVSAQSAFAGDTFTLTASGITQGAAMSPIFAFCAPDKKPGENLRPEMRWEGIPAKAKSLALVMVDPDVPTDFSDAGKKGKTIPTDMKRQNFYHWVVFNIPLHVTRLPAGKSALSIGKEWVNDYAAFHPDAPAKNFTGYDGPCPPCNDARLHHYHFQLHALNVEVLKPSAKASAKDVAKEIAKHSIAQAEVTGTYTLNKDVKY